MTDWALSLSALALLKIVWSAAGVDSTTSMLTSIPLFGRKEYCYIDRHDGLDEEHKTWLC